MSERPWELMLFVVLLLMAAVLAHRVGYDHGCANGRWECEKNHVKESK